VVAPRAYKTLALPSYFKANAGEQHDCSEFARVMLDQLESEIKKAGPSIRNINSEYIEGIKVNRIECRTCG
jgi:hypothetical protein